MLKVGLELFCGARPGGRARASRARAGVPRRQAARHPDHGRAGGARTSPGSGVDMLTVHALGGEAMMRGGGPRARPAARSEAGHPTPMVLAVTVLSSLSGEGLASPGVAGVRGDGGGARRRRRVGRGRRATSARCCGDGVLSRRPGHPSGRLERSRSGPHPDTRGGDRARRRLPRRRSTDHRVVRSRPASRAASSRRPLSAAGSTEKPQVARGARVVRPRRGRAYTPRRSDPPPERRSTSMALPILTANSAAGPREGRRSRGRSARSSRVS